MLDRSQQILVMVIGVGGADRGGLGVGEVLDPLVGLEVIFDPEGFAPGVDPLEGVRAEAVHVAIAGGNAAIAEQHGELVRGLRRMGEEIPGVLGLLHVGEGIALLRMDEVGEFQRIADEEDRRVVADQIVIALLRIEFEGEAARIAHHVGRAALQRHCRETQKHIGALAHGAEELRPGPVAAFPGDFEIAVGARPARVHDPLGDALAVETRQLLDQIVVLHQHRAGQARGLRTLIIGHGCGVLGRQSWLLVHRWSPVGC